MKQAAQTYRGGFPAPALPRRARIAWAARLACGAALTVTLLSSGLVQPAAAQDDTIVHSAGGSELIVSPGTAQANSAVAQAHAEPGFAETIAAGARAVADSDCGAFTEASAASAVAIPDAGAATEAEGGGVLSERGLGIDDDSADDSLVLSDPGAFAEQLTAEILSENEALQMIEGNDDSDDVRGPVRAEAKNQKDGEEVSIRRVEECIAGKEKEKPPVYEAPPVYETPAPEPVVYEVPVTGSGALGSSQLASLFAAASLVAGLGAVGLGRPRRILAEAAVADER